MRDVDERGNANVVEAAEAAGVERFVFVSFTFPPSLARSPLGAAKRATRERLARSPMREVVVQPDMFQEIWLSKDVGLDWAVGKVRICGKGKTPHAYVAVDDVAEATVRLALHDDPPRELEFGGPETLTREQVVERFEHDVRIGGGPRISGLHHGHDSDVAFVMEREGGRGRAFEDEHREAEGAQMVDVRVTLLRPARSNPLN